jgi:hypothetical protein
MHQIEPTRVIIVMIVSCSILSCDSQDARKEANYAWRKTLTWRFETDDIEFSHPTFYLDQEKLGTGDRGLQILTAKLELLPENGILRCPPLDLNTSLSGRSRSELEPYDTLPSSSAFYKMLEKKKIVFMAMDLPK